MASTAAGAKPLKLVLKPRGSAPAPAGATGSPPPPATAPAGGAPPVAATAPAGSWPVLRGFLEAVFTFGATASGHSFEELYRTIEDAVAARHGRQLYELLRGSMRDNTSAAVQHLLGAGGSQDTAAFLGNVAATWAAHCTQLVVIRNVFLSLDRTYARDAPGAPSI